jgi:hypothetical protein
VLNARSTAGVNVATAPAQATVPATAVAPGPASKKLVAGEASVAQLIASLNVALSTCVIGTPVAVFNGTVAITTGAGVIVVNVQT